MMKLYTYISLPGLIIHELMHIIFGALSGYFFSFEDSFTLWREDGALMIGMEPKNKKMNLFQMIMVPMAPLYLIIAIAILGFFNPIFIGILFYIIITWIYSFPSEGDFNMLRYARVFLRYSYDDEGFKRFMSMKNTRIFKSINKDFNDIALEDFDLED